MRLFSFSPAITSGIVAVTTVIVSLSRPASAQLLVDPTNGTVLFSGSGAGVYDPTATSGDNYDDQTVDRALPAAFSFFGKSASRVSIGVNGNINFAQDTAYSNSLLPDTGDIARISPLWDDLYVTQGTDDLITENATASYYAVSWNVQAADTVRFFNNPTSAARQQFQAILFSAPTTIDGFSFQTGDIAFDYAQVSDIFSYSYTNADLSLAAPTATVGLDKGDGTTAVHTLTTSGVFTDGEFGSTDQRGKLPILDASDQFFLFRPNGSGGYTFTLARVPIVAPESGSLLLVGIGVIGLGLRYRSRRHRNPGDPVTSSLE